MKNRRGTLFLGLTAFFIFFLSSRALDAQTSAGDKPEWYIYQRGVERYREGDYGAALKAVKELQESYGDSPEADYLLARVYREEGENELAEKFLSRALDKSAALVVPEEKYEILYHLAEIHFQRKNYKKYEDVLERILNDQDTYANPRYSRLRDSYVRTAAGEGFDAMVRLYRLKNDFARAAHQGLGILYCRTGREQKAVLHLLFSNLAAVTSLTEELKSADPGYVYTTLRDALEKSRKLPFAEEFLRESESFQSLYFLASAMYGYGAHGRAKELWEIVGEFGSGEWKTKSKNQLVSPKPEPLIVY